MDPITGLPRRSTISGSDAQREGLNTETQDWTLIKAGELAEPNVIVIDGDTSIEEACDILIQKSISSAPVYDSTTNTYVGMFDWSDVMSYLLIVLKKKNILEQQQKSDEELTSEFKDLLKLATECQPIPVKLASDLSHKNPFQSVLPETPLLKVVELFGSGTHRAVVIDAEGKIKGILTQSKVVTYLYQNVIKFPSIERLFPKKMDDLSIGRRPVISAQADSFVLDALMMM
ncbi:392_t:CDS:2, partial [Acaulospora colombiana]